MGLTDRSIRAVLVAGAVFMSGACDKEWSPVTDSGQTVVMPEEDPDSGIVWTEVNDNVSMSEVKVLRQNPDTFMKGYWPDGKLVPVRKGGMWQLFWGEGTDALTVAATPFPEDHIAGLTNDSKVWGRDFPESIVDGFNDGGSWFIAVFPLDDAGHYAGFFHAESHWDSGGIAHKSIGVAYSDNYGATWRDPEPVITDKNPKPDEPAWTGLGDGCIIRDEENSRYICYYQGKIKSGANALCMAASYDRSGASGSWLKWDGNDFTLPAYDKSTGLGGENIPISGLVSVTGANPSVMWNGYLGKWVMVYASWEKRIYMSFSDDAIRWSSPELIFGDRQTPACYPNLISGTGDLTGGETVQMYWSHNQNETTGIRDIAYAKIRFRK